jgi:hypothetical protein
MKKNQRTELKVKEVALSKRATRARRRVHSSEPKAHAPLAQTRGGKPPLAHYDFILRRTTR